MLQQTRIKIQETFSDTVLSLEAERAQDLKQKGPVWIPYITYV